MITNFNFSGMPKLFFGAGTVGRLAEAAATFGRTALLVTGERSLERSGHLARILADLDTNGIRVHHCRVAGEPTPDLIDQTVAAFRRRGVDLVLAIGGGSVIDAGKAVGAMLTESVSSASVCDYLEGVGSRSPSGRSLPTIAVPTTAGTGSEATKNAVISRVGIDGFKRSLRHDNYIPRLAILDPGLCTHAPVGVTAACGMDALTQLIESYVSSQASPLTDSLAMHGLRHLIPALPDACAKGAADPGCRAAVAYGAFLSGVSLANAGLGVVHGVAGPMGGLIDVPHGVACANLLPFAVAASVENLIAADTDSARVAIDKFARIGRLFGASSNDRLDRCRHLVDCLYEWLARLGIPQLGTFGLTRSHVDLLVAKASNKNNPLPLSPGQIERMIVDRR